jgi:ferredoxin
MTGRARLIVDPIACDGRGLCAELLPELITLDDWGYPMITAAEIPAHLAAEAAAVVRLCPRLAIRVEQVGTKAR